MTSIKEFSGINSLLHRLWKIWRYTSS